MRYPKTKGNLRGYYVPSREYEWIRFIESTDDRFGHDMILFRLTSQSHTFCLKPIGIIVLRAGYVTRTLHTFPLPETHVQLRDPLMAQRVLWASYPVKQLSRQLLVAQRVKAREQRTSVDGFSLPTLA